MKDWLAILLARSRGLHRFRVAQDSGGAYMSAVRELHNGRKLSHWMWFVFPQGKGLGQSRMSKTYALSRREAGRYLREPELAERLRLCVELMNDWLRRGHTAEDILGPVDAVKYLSCLELFHSVGYEPFFGRSLMLARSRSKPTHNVNTTKGHL